MSILKNRAMLSSSKELQKEFWIGFNHYCKSNSASFLIREKPVEKWHYDIRFGLGKAKVSLTCNTKQNYISSEIYISDDKAAFHFLERNRVAIEKELNLSKQLEWMLLPEGKDSRIKYAIEADVFDRSKWTQYYYWLFTHADIFFITFRKYLHEHYN